jgi:hypothetical protein
MEGVLVRSPKTIEGRNKTSGDGLTRMEKDGKWIDEGKRAIDEMRFKTLK